jgi:hypothetical protein
MATSATTRAQTAAPAPIPIAVCTPEVIAARPHLGQLYPAPLRVGFKMMGIKSFLRLDAAPVDAEPS